MKTLPTNLQRMISDARWAVENREPLSDSPELDEGMKAILQGVDQWTENLSRGEFDQELYWRCQAEDCEEDGDWEGAIKAHRQVLQIVVQHGLTHSWAHQGLASISNLFGDEISALQHFQSATRILGYQVLETLHAEAVIKEIWHLLRMRQAEGASQRLAQLLSEKIEWNFHCFAHSHVLLTEAACHIMSGNARNAKKSLSKSWHALSSLLNSLTSSGIADGIVEPPGVMNLRGTWWLVEAERCRLVGKPKAELQAWRESLRIAKHLAEDDPISVVYAEYSVMRRLLSLAECCQRQGFVEEASRLSVEAESIAQRRKFPETAKRNFSLQPASRPSIWQRFLNRF